jgi:ABC-type lipoprotein export system ATPase subunit
MSWVVDPSLRAAEPSPSVAPGAAVGTGVAGLRADEVAVVLIGGAPVVVAMTREAALLAGHTVLDPDPALLTAAGVDLDPAATGAPMLDAPPGLTPEGASAVARREADEQPAPARYPVGGEARAGQATDPVAGPVELLPPISWEPVDRLAAEPSTWGSVEPVVAEPPTWGAISPLEVDDADGEGALPPEIDVDEGGVGSEVPVVLAWPEIPVIPEQVEEVTIAGSRPADAPADLRRPPEPPPLRREDPVPVASAAPPPPAGLPPAAPTDPWDGRTADRSGSDHGVATPTVIDGARAGAAEPVAGIRRAAAATALGHAAVEAVGLGWSPAGAVASVVSGIDLRVAPGEIVEIVGAHRSGKSVLVELIAGLRTPTEGRIVVGSLDQQRAGADERSRRRAELIGVILQTSTLAPDLTALQNVQLPLLVSGWSPAEAGNEARRVMADLGIEDAASRRPGELAASERQLAMVARAVAGDPLLVVADEPTAHLRGRAADCVRRVLGSLARRGAAVVVTGVEPSGFADDSHVVRLVGGRLHG